MGKKIAAGSHSIVLDVKVGSGAFMKTVEQAEELATEMVKIGNGCGRKTAAVLTDMNVPLGHAVGNSLEIAEAVAVLRGENVSDLRQVCVCLAANMVSLTFDLPIEEAEKRGLYNLKSTPDALPMWIAQKNIDLFTKHSIFTSEELHSRYEIWLENYSKTINIESNTMVEMVQKDLLPSVMSYIEEIASTASLKASVVPGITCESETALITKLSGLQDAMTKGLEKLKSDTAKARATEDVLENAKLYQAEVLEDMEELRKSADEAETLIPDDLLPYPTYGKLLFYI